MEIKLGYNKLNGLTYPHDPSSEKKLFYETINNYIDLNNHLTDINGVEIGVLNGETSAFLLDVNSKIKLTGIDPIIPDSMESSLIGSLEIIKSNTKKNESRFNFIHNYSYNVVSMFEDNEIDFLFIDGDHTYDAVSQDFELYFPKVKKGGLIFLHDSRMYRGGANFHVGSSLFCDFIINEKYLELIGEAFSLTAFKK
jgi:hypothetical protein